VPDKKSFLLSRKLLGEEFIEYVMKCKAAGASVADIAKQTKMPEMVIASVIRSKSLVDTNNGVD
jgi:hypothetical protein